MPSDSSLAFVVIWHLSPDFESLMDELLSRQTEIAIHRAEDKMLVEPNALYLLPPKKDRRIDSDAVVAGSLETLFNTGDNWTVE